MIASQNTELRREMISPKEELHRENTRVTQRVTQRAVTQGDDAAGQGVAQKNDKPKQGLTAEI